MRDDGIARARRLLEPPQSGGGAVPALGAAALAATAAVLMAGVAVLGPGLQFEEAPPAQSLFPNG